MKFLFLALISISVSAVSHAEEILREYSLKMNYTVACPAIDDSAFPGITGSVRVHGRTLRIDLLKYNHTAELTLAFPEQPKPSELYFEWDRSNDCTLENFTSAISEEAMDGDLFKSLALKHSPYLVVRKDQLTERTRDLPLALTYSVMPTNRKTKKIRYTIFFSNETVHGLFSTSKAASLSHYGRRTDIEWMYDVEFDDNLNVISRKYQGGIIGGFGHATRTFKGKFLAGSQHPVLFDIAAHNVFSSKGEWLNDELPARVGYHFVPREEIPNADAREWWQWKKPWVFDLSDRELRRGQGKSGEFEAPAGAYLYILLTGKMNKSRLRLNFENESFFIRGGAVSKLGEGLWGKQTFTAVKMSEAEMASGGEISMFRLKRGLIFKHWGFLDLEPLKFYRLRPDADQGFVMADVSDQFKCDEDFRCQYGRNASLAETQAQ